MMFILKAAFRDLRFDYLKLALAVAAITAGVAAITAVSGLGNSVSYTIAKESRNLLGADLIFESRRPFRKEVEIIADSLPGEKARIISMATMAYFPKQETSRLVNLRAIQGRFPLYGTFTVLPETAASYQESGGALIDESLQVLYDLQPGDSIKVGRHFVTIAGFIKAAAGEAANTAFTGPRVFIPLAEIDKTGLVQTGSLITNQIAFASPTFDYETFNSKYEERLRELDVRSETVKERQRSLGRATDNLTRFLSMIGLFTLLIGGTGVAGAVHSYIRRKHKTVAVLRCIGAKPGEAVLVYTIQTLLFSVAASLLGLGAGMGILYVIPVILQKFLPFELMISLTPTSYLLGPLTGIAVSVLFSAGSMTRLLSISPMEAIRSGNDEKKLSWTVQIIIGTVGAGMLFSISSVIGNSLRDGALFTLLTAAVLLLFVLGAAALVQLTKKIRFTGLPFWLKNALAGLFRPNNQTTAIVTVVGFSVFLVTLIAATQTSLLKEVEQADSGGRPNMMLIDIQSDQKEAVADLLAAENAPLTQMVPIVTMRIASLKGLLPDSALARNPKIPAWALKREFRSSYRNEIVSTEKILKGSWPPAAVGNIIPLSLEQEIARQLGVSIGDEITFDVQGIPFECQVAAIREVDWQSLQPNFFVIFPAGVLESAPQFFVAVTRTPDSGTAARIKRNLALTIPNVTVIDLDLIVKTVEGILDKVAWVLRFMSLFTLGTGLLVFASSMYATRAAREKESAVLRTLGSSYAGIRNASQAEYFIIGTLASFFGMLLALTASGVVMELVFQARLSINAGMTFLIPAGAVLMLMSIGWLMNRRILKTSPMKLLRSE